MTEEGESVPSFKEAKDGDMLEQRKPKGMVPLRLSAGPSATSSPLSLSSGERAPDLGRAPEKGQAPQEGENTPSSKQARGNTGSVRRDQIRGVVCKRTSTAAAASSSRE